MPRSEREWTPSPSELALAITAVPPERWAGSPDPPAPDPDAGPPAQVPETNPPANGKLTDIKDIVPIVKFLATAGR